MNEHEPFSLDAWIDSVQGKTVIVDAPNDYGDVLGVPLPSGYTAGEGTLCGNCEAIVMLISDRDSILGECPRCGRTPGMLELGTDSVEDWRKMPEEVKSI